MFFLWLYGCNVLLKTASEKSCESAASSFASCAAISDQISIPYTYDELSASVACSVQPDCLEMYFACVSRAFSTHDCSTENGAQDAISEVQRCELPEHNDETCPIEQYLPDDDCGGTPPVIQEIECTYKGIQFSQQDQEELPAMDISVRVTDTDGDLTGYHLLLHVDDELDGVVGSGARAFSFEGTTSAGTCDTDESNLGIDLYLKGGFPHYSTVYEWFFTVEDVSGLRSMQVMKVCTTPDEMGENPQ